MKPVREYDDGIGIAAHGEFYCACCDTEFDNQDAYWQHKGLLYSCICDKRFRTNDKYRKHIKKCGVANANALKCNHCNVIFDDNHALNRHLESLYTCPCSKRYSSRSSFNRHAKQCPEWIYAKGDGEMILERMIVVD